ncbi:MAG: hypothetical protein ACFFC7_02620 [Candidatus Hermodarchaeota archaeon]
MIQSVAVEAVQQLSEKQKRLLAAQMMTASMAGSNYELEAGNLMGVLRVLKEEVPQALTAWQQYVEAKAHASGLTG